MNDDLQTKYSQLLEKMLDEATIHARLLKEADDRFHAERDRRYAEVKNAEEKALKVKDEADKTALGLQRENQVYKDEKANQLREQINSERGLYASKDDLENLSEKIQATMKPISEWIAGKQGSTLQVESSRKNIQWAITLALGAAGFFAGWLITYLMQHKP